MLALFISLVTVSVVGVQFGEGRAQITRETGQRLAGDADLVAQRVARDVRERVRSAAVWSQLETAQDVVTDDIDKRLAVTLERLVRSLGPEDVGLAMNDSGRLIAASSPSLMSALPPAIALAARRCAGARAAGGGVQLVPAASGPLLAVASVIRARGDGRPVGCLLLVTPWSALVRAAVPRTALDRVAVRHETTVLWSGALFSSGEPLVTGLATLSAAGVDLGVNVAQSRRDALAPVRERGLSALLLAIAVMAVSLPAAFIVARSTTQPLRALTESALALRDDGGAGLATPSGDAPREVRVLHAALESMLRRLDQSRRAMSEREALVALGTMAAALAHEIRTPLAVVQSSTQLLEREMRETRREELGALVIAEVQRLDRLVGDLLTFARPRPPDRRPADLRAVVRRAAELLAPLASERGVTLELALEPAAVDLDEEQFQQVVLNLASNAIQFSPRGATVRIVTGSSGARALLTVMDSGPGIPSDRLPEIWKPFHTTRRGGTGLGLSIARQIVERHGGTIDATSIPAAGTTLRVAVPVRAASSSDRTSDA